MNEQNIIQEAKEYVYDLGNAAREYGFKATEHWQLSLVSASEKKALERNYYPTVAIALLPEAITNFIAEVKKAMSHLNAVFTRAGNIGLRTSQQQFLVAYNTLRSR